MVRCASVYYVYELTDPRDGLVFYVGKGKGARWRHHSREARKGKYSRKCDLIREIEALGLEYGVSFVGHYMVEADAYEAERLHIEKIGLDALTNVIPGGTGGYDVWRPGRKPTPLETVKAQAINIRKILFYSETGLQVRMQGVEADLLAIGRKVCLKLRDAVGVEEFNRVVKPLIVSNGVTNGI